MKFNFQILISELDEEGHNTDRGMFIFKKFESISTELNFYLHYSDGNFTVRTDNLQSKNTNDFKFILNEIVKKLGE